MRSLSANSRLNTLHLNAVGLGADAAPALAAAIGTERCALSVLWLGGNALDDAAAASLAAALRGARAPLRKLWLADNPAITYAGARELVRAALASGRMRQLWLGGGRLGAVECAGLREEHAAGGNDAARLEVRLSSGG